MTLTIVHTRVGGTVLEGTSKGDGASDALRAAGWPTSRWRWGFKSRVWFVPQSRDSHANQYLIDKSKAVLQAAGFEVVVSIDDREHRTTAQVEADKAERASARADALDAKAERKATAAEAAWGAEQRASNALPPGGEPIKIGHHSQRRHENAIEKAHKALGRAVDVQHEANEVARRAEVAAHATDRRYAPVTVANRIKKLEAEQRADERELDGYERTYAVVKGIKYGERFEPADGSRRQTLIDRMVERADQIEFWKSVRAEQQRLGIATAFDRKVIVKGDAVKSRGAWHRVVRVSAKSVSVETGYSWTDIIPYAEIRAVQTADGREVNIVDGARVIAELGSLEA